MLSAGPDGGHSSDLEAAIWSRQGRKEGREIVFLCPNPTHKDHHPSGRWNPDKRTWYCDVCKVGGGEKDLCHRLSLRTNGHATRPSHPRQIEQDTVNDGVIRQWHETTADTGPIRSYLTSRELSGMSLTRYACMRPPHTGIA